MFPRIIKILCVALMLAFGMLAFFVAYMVPIAIGFSLGTLGMFCIICAGFVGFDDYTPAPAVTYAYPDEV